MELLQSSNERVLRLKSTSTAGPKILSGGIDKLDGYFTNPIPVNYIKDGAKSQGLTCKLVHLRDKRRYLEVGNNQRNVHLRLSPDNQHVTCYVSNPNRFGSWSNYWSFFKSFAPDLSQHLLHISRLDLNLDFECSLMELVKSIDIRNKRTAISFIDISGVREGITLGKGNETIVIYDKSKQSNLTNQVARLELRLRGNKLPTKTIQELVPKIQSEVFLGNIVGIHFSESATELPRMKEFHSVLNRDGFYLAKKQFNQNKNFDRDIGSLLSIQQWSQQPSELIKQEIHRFFKQEEVNHG